MAIIGMDGFDHYGTGDSDDILQYLDTVEGYSVPSDPTIDCVPSDRFGQGNCLRMYRTGGIYFNDVDAWNTDTGNKIVISFALKMGPYAESDYFLGIRNGSGFQCRVRWDQTTGQLKYYRQNDILVATSVGVLAKETWYWIEVKAVIDGSESSPTGTFELRVDGSSTDWFNLTNTRTGYYTTTPLITGWNIRASGNGSNKFMYFDDLVWQNDAADSDFLGDSRITTLYPNTDVSTQFTPSNSTGEDNAKYIDDDIYDPDSQTDLTYVYSDTVGHQDTYDFSTIDDSDNVHAIGLAFRARKTDTKTRTMKNITTANSQEGAIKSLSTSYQYFTDVFENQNPTGPVSWNQTNIGTTNFGIEVES